MPDVAIRNVAAFSFSFLPGPVAIMSLPPMIFKFIVTMRVLNSYNLSSLVVCSFAISEIMSNQVYTKNSALIIAYSSPKYNKMI